jgi:hypothetical protein
LVSRILGKRTAFLWDESPTPISHSSPDERIAVAKQENCKAKINRQVRQDRQDGSVKRSLVSKAITCNRLANSALLAVQEARLGSSPR